MNNSHKISRSQLFCIMLLTRLSAELVYPLSGGIGFSATAELLAAEAVRLILALPFIIYAFVYENYYGEMLKKSRFIGKCTVFFGFALLAGFALRTLFYTAEFAEINLLPEMPEVFLLLPAAALAAYLAVKGVEAAARSGVIVLIIAAVITITVILADIPRMKFDRELAGVIPRQFLNGFIERLARGGEYLVFAVLLPYTRREENKSAGSVGLWFALSSAASGTAFCLFFTSVLGEYYGMANYPIAAAASLSDIAVLSRLDGIACAVWSLASAFRVGIFSLCCVLLFKLLRSKHENN